MMPRRRLFGWAAGAAAVVAAPAAVAQTSPKLDLYVAPEKLRLFKTVPLSMNKVAMQYEVAPPGLTPPDLQFLSDSGPRRFSELTGKVRMVSIWGEWCPPCLAEVHDLSELRRRQADSRFDIVAIATMSKLDIPQSRALLAKYGAPDLPTWIEPNHGHLTAQALARRTGRPEGSFSAPCNLLVDAQGRIRGRAFGAAEKGSTAWALPAADTFVGALKQGALDPV